MKQIFITLIVMFGIMMSTFSQSRNPGEDTIKKSDEYANHEDNSKVRYNLMQKALDTCFHNKDSNGIRLISAELDAQLKLEDFLIKFREADSIKLTTAGTVLIPALVSLLTALITIFFTRKASKHPPKGATSAQ